MLSKCDDDLIKSTTISSDLLIAAKGKGFSCDKSSSQKQVFYIKYVNRVLHATMPHYQSRNQDLFH